MSQKQLHPKEKQNHTCEYERKEYVVMYAYMKLTLNIQI